MVAIYNAHVISGGQSLALHLLLNSCLSTGPKSSPQ
jgi:hypothetical protein